MPIWNVLIAFISIQKERNIFPLTYILCFSSCLYVSVHLLKGLERRLHKSYMHGAHTGKHWSETSIWNYNQIFWVICYLMFDSTTILIMICILPPSLSPSSTYTHTRSYVDSGVERNLVWFIANRKMKIHRVFVVGFFFAI